MMVRYEGTVDELVRASLAQHRSRPGVRRIELGFALATAVLLGFSTAAQLGAVRGVLAGVAAAVASVAIFRFTAIQLQRWLLRRTTRKVAAPDGTVRIELAALESGLRVDYGTWNAVVPWSLIVMAVETEHGLELLGTYGPLLLLPPRPGDAQARAEFLRTANACIDAAR